MQNCFLEMIAELEDLAEKKTQVYARLLTDAELANNLEELSARHAKRKQVLEGLALNKANEEDLDEEDGE